MASFHHSSYLPATVTNVHKKGFAFAKTDGGDDVFISPPVHEALGKPGRGERVSLKVERGKQGLKALEPPPHTTVSWESWQVGNDQLRLPDTEPGTEHAGLRFQCFRCGAELVGENDIWKIKGSCVWTKTVPDSFEEAEGKPRLRALR